MSNKKVLVTGGSGGIGKQVINYLKDSEYEVLSPTSSELNLDSFDNIDRYASTPTVEDAPHITSSELLELYPDILIHCAVKNLDSTIINMGPDVVEPMINTNVKGLSYVVQMVLPAMRRKEFGRIIYLSSVLSRDPIAGTALYAASKSFGETFIRTAALENARYGITCNTIRMGYFDRGLIEKVPKKVLTKVKESIPLQRLGTVPELCNVIAMLIDTEYVTGSTIDITGGL